MLIWRKKVTYIGDGMRVSKWWQRLSWPILLITHICSTFQIIGNAIVSRKLTALISFTNPLPVSLQGGVFTVEGAGLTESREIKTQYVLVLEMTQEKILGSSIHFLKCIQVMVVSLSPVVRLNLVRLWQLNSPSNPPVQAWGNCLSTLTRTDWEMSREKPLSLFGQKSGIWMLSQKSRQACTIQRTINHLVCCKALYLACWQLFCLLHFVCYLFI